MQNLHDDFQYNWADSQHKYLGGGHLLPRNGVADREKRGWRARGKAELREFIDWVYQDASSRQGTNPGRTANKVRSHLRAVLSWAWEHDLVETLPRFPRLKPQRDVAGRHDLTKPELNALYFATHQLRRPRGWNYPWPVGRYWRCALVVFFNYGVDTGTVWKTLPFHGPIRWRHVSWGQQSPDREIKERCPWGWLYYRRVKTGKVFWRPMNRKVRLHLKSLRPEHSDPDALVFASGEHRYPLSRSGLLPSIEVPDAS